MKTERLEPPTAPQAAVRIGFLFPVGEPTTAEYYELAERLDEPAELFVARTGGLDRHDEAGMVETGRVERLRIRLNALRAHAPHVIAFPCTCARFGYPAGADTQAAELARAAGVPATSATVDSGRRAVLSAIRGHDRYLSEDLYRSTAARGIVDLALFYGRNNFLSSGHVFATLVERFEGMAAACQDVWYAGAKGETLRFEAR